MVYLVRLNNGQRVKVHIFVVYDDPQAIQHAAKPGEDCFQWTCVQRSACKKGCDGPILRAIQRYGRLGRWGSQYCWQLQVDWIDPQGAISAVADELLSPRRSLLTEACKQLLTTHLASPQALWRPGYVAG